MKARRFDEWPMSVEEFLAWHERQDERYELVQGIPLRMMTGARQDHNVVKLNVAAFLLPRIRERGCRTTTSDMAVRTASDQIRYPDVLVDCGPSDPDALEASEPRLIVEVASPSTRDFDEVEKLAEYQSIPSVAYVLRIEPNVVDVNVHARGEDGWTVRKHTYLDDVIDLAALGIELPVTEVYAGLTPDLRTPIELVPDGPEGA